MKKLLSYIKNSAFLPICAGIAAIQPPTIRANPGVVF